MDSNTLSTAATYLNNLLLARGLLRNGKAIDFAKPTRETRAQTINLVHDLLLQRDKYEDSREYAADAIRRLRSDQERKDVELTRLRSQLVEKERAWTVSQAEARNSKADLKKMQSSVKNLQGQLAKTKTLCDQIKTQCANDIRKRDLHIEKLKSHLQGQQRGNKSLVVAPSISISGGSGSRTNFAASLRSIGDPEYTLKQESNEFLTQLSQSLSDENDGLLTLVNGALQTLRELLGVEDATMMDGGNHEDEATQTPAYQRMGVELNTLMNTLKSLLTNPNFVSVEEVDLRDEEIARLRDGWEKMETRWKDVLLMMDGWRKRLEKSGDTINLDDLQRGLGLDVGFEELKKAVSPSRPSRLPRPSVRPSSSEEEDDTMNSGLASRDSGVSGMADADAEEQDRSGDKPLIPSPVKAATLEPPEFFDLRPGQTRGQQLRQLSGNIQSPRRVAFHETLVEDVAVQSVARSTRSTRSRKASDTENHSISGESRSSHMKGRKRSSSPQPLPSERTYKQRVQAPEPEPEPEPPQSSSFLEEDVPQMTLQEKLLAAQTEADHARLSPHPIKVNFNDGESELELDMVASLRSPVKKSKIKGRPRRRKSTLNPEELASLLNLD